MNNLGFGALTLVGFIAMTWFVIEWIRVDNANLKQKEAWKNNSKWNWD